MSESLQDPQPSRLTVAADPPPQPRRRCWAAAIAAATAMALHGVLVAPRRVQTTRHTVGLANLPESLAGLRIVQISDVHFGPLFRAAAARRAVALANACDPDVVVLTGDFVTYRGLRYLLDGVGELGALHARLGVFACLGNHDHWEDAPAIQRALSGVGVRVLVNESVPLADGLWLAAIDDIMAGEPDLAAAMRGIPPDQAAVLLSHNPAVLPHVSDRPWLTIAGHTHGGQLAVPGLGPRWTPKLPLIGDFMRLYEATGALARGGRPESLVIRRYPAGWYQKGEARMYVNRGIGYTLPLRLACPPELACFAVVPLARQ